MPGKAKRGRDRAGRRTKARVAQKGVKVTAVQSTAGRSATSVHVEVEPEELKREVGEIGDVRQVSARIPEDDQQRPGHVRWREERLQPAGTEERDVEGRRRIVKRYFNVHYGPSRSTDLGVGVRVDTEHGKVNAPPPGHAYTVRDESHPGESEIKKRK